MAWTIRQSVYLGALAACLATGFAAHAESAADKLKAQLGAQKNSAQGLAPARSQTNGAQGLHLSASQTDTASGTNSAGSLLGGALGSSATSGALGASALGGLGLPNIASGSASNVAGVLEYCVKNNYLKKANVNTLKDGLLNKAGLGKTEAEKDSAYSSGLSGMLSGGDGTSFHLNSIQDNVKEKACDYVLDNASSLL